MPETSSYPLPSGPPTLCFNKEEFMKDEFHVDQFVVECRRRVSLENLRDDLHVYFKILQAAMIELINQDYADFVNLSTNLVGLDKAINNISNPLSQFKQEVTNVKSAMDDAISAVEGKLKQQRDIRHKKTCVQRLMNIIQSVDKIEQLLGMQPGQQSHYHGELNGQLIERVATEFNRLQFYVNKSRGLPLVDQIKPRITNITTTLQFSLEGSFKEGLEEGDMHILRQCLRTYATIDKLRDAENLFRSHIVKPYMDQYITEQEIQRQEDGLRGMYTKVIDFIPQRCKRLKEVTCGTPQGGGEVVRGYDFIVNAVWPEVVSSIEARIPSIFAPGNPDMFHKKYCISMEFLDRFERQCGSQASVKRLRAHASYNTFLSKWSMPVYFQIRFQEIAGSYETALVTAFNNTTGDPFHLHATQALWDCLHRCWSSDVYLQPLSHRFWKLTVQLLARHVTWINEVKSTEITKEIKTSEQVKAGTPEPGLETGAPVKPLAPPVTLRQLVCLVTDAQNLSSKIPTFLKQTIMPYFEKIGLEHMDLFSDSIEESQQAIQSPLPVFSEHIVNEVTQHCVATLKLVNDIPRLYRRTNREVPSKASSYLNSLVKPLQLFLDEQADVIDVNTRRSWIQQVLINITEQYHSITSDVLTSVKKMEESLKRLKRGRAATAQAGTSDDDKIRLQLALDVQQFGKEIETLGIEQDLVTNYKKLHELVEEAKNNSAGS